MIVARTVFVASAVLGCALLGLPAQVRAQAATPITVESQLPGVTPFIAKLTLAVQNAQQVAAMAVVVSPKAGSFTRPISATYSAAALVSRGYWDGASAAMTVPVFGLYAGAANSVVLTVTYQDGSSAQQNVSVATASYTSTCARLNGGVVLNQSRTSTAELSYDYLMVKEDCDGTSPHILDTDGNLRWVGTDNDATTSVIFIGNRLYLARGAGVDTMEFDGSHAVLANYSSMGITKTATTHNFDHGRTGIIMDVATPTQAESTNAEIDTSGKLLNKWDFSVIIGNAMRAGGDDPGTFISTSGGDWFHDNSATYNPTDNTLIVSSRENFVIAVDYDTQAIRWIFGDPNKAWHQYPSLRAFALTPASGTLPPIGQHSVNIDLQGDLLLFDDGKGSVFHRPVGLSRNYSAPRSYHIDGKAMTATQTFAYLATPSLDSRVCGSAYEDTPDTYLFDYATADNGTHLDLFGVTASNQRVFEFQYPQSTCRSGWNAVVVHLDNLQF